MEKGKELEIGPVFHRRILQFLNAAARPEDLMKPPEKTVRPEWRGGGRNRPFYDDHTDRGQPKIKPKSIMKRKDAECILAERGRISPLQGFFHLDQIVRILDLDWVIDLIRTLSVHLGPSAMGTWEDGGTVEKDGTSYRIAHGALLRTGKVLFIEAACEWNNPTSETPIWNPETGDITIPVAPADNLYCAGHAFLSDGTLLAVGGGGENGNPEGDPSTGLLFDPVAETWDVTKDLKSPGNPRTKMLRSRWYPTVVTLGDDPGRSLIASGYPAEMEIYSENTGTYSLVTATPDPTMDVDTNGNKNFPQLYPGLHPLPGGEIFYAPVGFADNGEDLPNTDAVQESAHFEFDYTATGAVGKWTDRGAAKRTKGMSVLITKSTSPYLQVMMIGGGVTDSEARKFQLIDVTGPSTTWSTPQDLPTDTTTGGTISPRIHPNVVLLPDGTVFVCGGVADTTAPCLLYDPETGIWTRLASLASFRGYHSLALLLPSGEVVATGGTGGRVSDNVLEIYKPPYLNTGGTPPKIDNVSPDPIHHGKAFTITLENNAVITKVTLVRPMAVTHQTDSEQRVIKVDHLQTGTKTLTATAPNGGHPHALAPKGWYMLFVIDNNGVPSKGEFVFLH
ncbi:MAG: DUF1929 domain-containing protein [Verrucomicrobia bacterium]|nr:DUF1929 domain-containing protein [Verrucomicrobiota bacterium]